MSENKKPAIGEEIDISSINKVPAIGEETYLSELGAPVPEGFKPGAVAETVPAMKKFAETGIGRLLNILPATIQAQATLPSALIGNVSPTKYLTDTLKGFTGLSPDAKQQVEDLGFPEKTDFNVSVAPGDFGERVYIVEPGNKGAPIPVSSGLGAALKTGSELLGPEVAASSLKKIIPWAKTAAVESHLRPTPQMRQIVGKQGVKEIADEIYKSKVMPWWGTIEDTGTNLERILNEKTGPAFDAFESTVNATGKNIPANTYFSKLEEVANSPLINKEGWSEGITKSLLNDIKKAKTKQGVVEYGPNPALNLTKVRKNTSILGQKAGFDKVTAPEKSKGFQSLWGASRNMEKENLLSPEQLDEYEKLLSAYANQMDAAKMAGRTSSLHGGGLVGRLGDTGLTLEIGKEAAKGNLLGVPIGLARALTKGRLSGFSGNLANALSMPIAGNIGSSLKVGSQISPSIWDLIRLQGDNQ